MGKPDEGEDAGLDWYMNKSFKSRAVKVLSSDNRGCCKMRFMAELLGGDRFPHHAQPTQPKTGVPTSTSSQCAPDATKPACDAVAYLTENDEDDKIGNMTLKEMRQWFKKSAQKPSKKQSFSIASPACPLWINAPEIDTVPVSDCSLQLGGLELHLDSSTSNSAESSDDLSSHGIATSFHKPLDSDMHESEVVVQMADHPGQVLRKRKSTLDGVVSKSEIAVEDDDCTLEMWQVHKRQSFKGKKARRCGVEQAPCMDEQTSYQSSMTPAAISVLCSSNLAPDTADSTCPSNVAPALGNFVQGSPALSCSFEMAKVLRKKSLEPQSNLSTPAITIEHGSSESEELHSYVLMKENAKISREIVKDYENTQEHGPLSCERSPICSSGESSQADKPGRIPLSTEAVSWPLKPCSKPLSAEVPVSIQQKVESNGWEPTLSSGILHGVDHGPSFASMTGSEQRTLDMGSNINKANDAAIVTKPFEHPVGVINKFVNDEVADPSQKDIAEVSPVDLSNYSPPLPSKLKIGFDTQQSNDVESMASQPLFDGSPVNLFSTERLDTIEEQELEQVKPSKIPCKRKAISPLSRERLLQASKFSDRERNFGDLDKRGLKKLPRAFKGFIGRDMFNHDHVAAFPRSKDTSLESSPPEKPHLKEEVLPGSPCHNREKVLPSKHLAPKASSISSSCGSSCAAAIVSPTMQTSSPSPSYVQRLSLVLNSSPSPPSQKNLKAVSGIALVNSSSPVPAKGILRSSSPTCQGACKCEECTSLRHRAEKAAEFSQRQMHDIEGLAVKLLKELSAMRCVVEESLIQRNGPRTDSPRSALSLEQVKKAANNAFETEKMAKSWLVRMARDCNRYCKIMRMQERKLTFADESGGQLCHVKLFHAQAQAQPDTMLSTEKPTASSCGEKATTATGNTGLTDEPAIEAASGES